MNSTITENLAVKKLKNNKELIIRPCNIDDAEKMLEYVKAVSNETDNLLFSGDEIKLTVEEERRVILNINVNENVILFLGLVDDEIVSLVQTARFHQKRASHNCDLAISVRKKYWNLGVATQMMQHIIPAAKEDGIKTVSLGVNAENKNAIKLYEKIGFDYVGVHKNYFNLNGKFVDEVLMDFHF